jgi:cytoskeletal protein RodZ
METLGIWLRRTREERSLTPEQVEVATRIKPRALEVLEAGNYSALPGGELQARGFLRIYARYLGFSPDEVMARYDAEVRGVRYVPQVRGAAAPASASPQLSTTAQLTPAPAPAPAPSGGPHRRWGTLETVLVGGLAVAMLIAVLAGVSYLISRNASATDGPSAAEAVVRQSEAIALAEAEPTAALPLPTPTLAFTAQGGITLTLKATEHVWVQVTSDDQVVFRGLLAPQQDVVHTALQRISVETGNGAALQATLNGQLLGALGERGQVTRRAWGPAGEVELPPAGP